MQLQKSLWSSYHDTIQRSIEDFQKINFFERIHDKDPYLWKDKEEEQNEITNRLGWLTCYRTYQSKIEELNQFANEVKDSGVQFIVLLGMGGSSLAPEVLQSVFGNKEGFPRLVILDSTDPRKISDVENEIDLSKTLFLVASKSGTTIESLSLYRYFWSKLEETQSGSIGNFFAAVTDPGSFLENEASEKGFRKTFLNDPDIGGRFSALSLFGLVPASLIGVDLNQLLQNVQDETLGIELGVSMAYLATQGRDKLTLITPSSWDVFGDWVEQLVAESTGKENKGIVPVVREKLSADTSYGNDRYFIYIKVKGESDNQTDELLDKLVENGHPVYKIEVSDKYFLGQEFLRWEIATAISGTVLKINPFDQPNVQEAKTETKNVLNDLSVLDKPQDSGYSLESLVKEIKDGDYVNLLAFLPDRLEVKDCLNEVANQIRQKTNSAVCIGIGPRYLHSTGQLHKGGANNGVFIVITAGVPSGEEKSIPQADYTFKQLELAQAIGDFQALKAKNRRVLYQSLEDISNQSLDAFRNSVKEALEKI